MSNEQNLETIIDANWSAYILARKALEKLKELKGEQWAQYVKDRWAGLSETYKPRIERRPDRDERESIWELQQRLSAAEREYEVLVERTRPLGVYGEPRGTAEERGRIKQLRDIIKTLNRRILDGK